MVVKLLMNAQHTTILVTLAEAMLLLCHSKKEWARDDDGDGVREVHCNTMEGIWTGLRNFLRPFRDVNKKYLPQYVAMFEWAHNSNSRHIN